ncbi:MAG: amidohydrolase [Acidobacteria bacterium]|nr:amidohydrolase [Acidobacteriota bacterium]
MQKVIAGGVAIAAAWVAVTVAAGTQPQAPAAPADLVLLNGAVLTVDARDSVAEALAVSGGKIVAVGTNAAIKARVGPATEVVDLAGRAVTPGLIDSHVHFSEADKLFNVDLSDPSVTSMDDVLQRVAARVKQARPGEWIRGRGWDEGRLAERRYITAADLDKVAPNNPVWLTQTTGHYGVANSYALKMAEVRKETKDPPAGTIDRDADGKPTGVLKEAAQGLVTTLVPPLTREQQKQGILEIIKDFNREGMTGAKDPGISELKWELYRELLQEGALNVRVFALWSGARQASDGPAVMARVQRQPKPPASFGDGMLLSGGVKMFMDGSGGARTAWMYEDWNKEFTGRDAGNQGYPSTPPDDYRQIVSALHAAGIHVSTHAIGDRAIDWVVDTYDQLLKATPTKGLRHGIIHGNTPTDHAIDVMARLQRDYDAAYPEAQAPFLWWIGDTYAANLGPERGRRLKPFRTFLQKGVQWGGGSDFAVTPYPARYGLWSSVVRETLNGTHGRTPFGTDESIDIRTALRSYTRWAAHTMFLEDRVGSIEVGKEADLAVWDRNPYVVPSAELKDLACQMTFVRGRMVYRAEPGGPAIR